MKLSGRLLLGGTDGAVAYTGWQFAMIGEVKGSGAVRIHPSEQLVALGEERLGRGLRLHE